MDGTWDGLVAYARLNAATPAHLANMAMMAVGLLGKLGQARFRRKPRNEEEALAAARAFVLIAIHLALQEGLEPRLLLEVEHAPKDAKVRRLSRSRAPR